MRKSLALSLLTVFVVSATTGAMAANTKSSGNPVANAGKKVCNGVAWPFRKAGAGMKKLTHKRKK